MKIKDLRIKCPEILFTPSLIEKDRDNIAQVCYNSIQKCDIDQRKDLYNSIIVTGGSSMFNGLPERLKKEMKKLAQESMKEEVDVISRPERKNGVWIGGSILSSIPTLEWITKMEYEESGATIIHKKCL